VAAVVGLTVEASVGRDEGFVVGDIVG
jgi:hypothetical protein